MSSNIFYGFEILNDKLSNEISEDLIELDKDLEIIYSGADFSNDGSSIFISIKKSRIKLEDDHNFIMIKQSKLIAPKEWHDRLVDWSNKNNCVSPKIGWVFSIYED